MIHSIREEKKWLLLLTIELIVSALLRLTDHFPRYPSFDSDDSSPFPNGKSMMHLVIRTLPNETVSVTRAFLLRNMLDGVFFLCVLL